MQKIGANRERFCFEVEGTVYVKKRDANIELLRIVSMILIVAGHFVGQNNVIEILDGNSLFVSLL